MQNNRNFRLSRRHSIGSRLTLYALGAAILLGFLLSFVGIAIDVSDERARLDRTMAQILETIAPAASRAAFQLNEGMGQEVLSGLFVYDFIRRARILDDEGRQLAAVERAARYGFPGDLLSRWLFAEFASQAIPLRVDQQATPVGRLALEMDARVIAASVVRRAIVVLVAGAVGSALFAILLLYLYHVVLTKPLKLLVDSFHAGAHDSPEFKRFPIPAGHEQDELGMLVETINGYFARLEAMRRLLGAKEESYRGLFDNTEVPMWNADFSALAPTLFRLRQEGVGDLRGHLAANGTVCQELLAGIRITRANGAALLLFKTETFDDFIRGFDQIFPPGDRAVPVDMLCAIWDRQAVYRSEATLRARDGEDLNVIVSFRVPETEAGFASVPVSIIDITKMKQSERELHQNLQRIEMTMTANNAGSWSWDMRTNKTIWSEENYRLLGYHPGEVEPDYDAWYSRVHPDDREFATEQVNTAVSEKTRLDFEYRAVMPDGSIRWLQDIGSFIEAEDGTISGMYGVQIDINHRKTLEAQLLQAQKMEAVGHLTGGVAHDFNNLLQVIQGNLDLALDVSGGEDRVKQFLRTALKAAQRGAALTQQLLAFSRKQTLSPEIVDPNGIIGGMLELLRRTLGDNVEVEALLQDRIAKINVDPNNLQNAVLNIAINAKAAMPKGGTLSIGTRTKRLTKAVAVEDGRLPAGDYVEISVTDSGCGMSPETLDHAFEPFYSTKDVGEGSGLGLSMVYGFVVQSGGMVTLSSKVDRGTTVTLLFPVVKTDSKPTRKERRSADPVRGDAKILVVEDDPEVRGTVMRLLGMGGYEAQDARDAVEALEIIANDDSIDILFSDVLMPKGMTGPELAHRAMRVNENLKVLLTSGYPDTELARSGVADVGFALLRKPYSHKQLFEALNAVLAGAGPASPD